VLANRCNFATAIVTSLHLLPHPGASRLHQIRQAKALCASLKSGTAARRDGRACASRAARGGGLPNGN